MQFDVSLAAGAARTAQRRSGDGALPDLLNLLQTLHAAPADRADEKRAALEETARKRSTRRDDLVHGTSQSQRALEQIKSDERHMRPGSAASRDAQRQELAERKSAGDGGTFKSALTSARSNNANATGANKPDPPALTPANTEDSPPAPPAEADAKAAQPGQKPADAAPPRATQATAAPWSPKPAISQVVQPAAESQKAVAGVRSVGAVGQTPQAAATGRGPGAEAPTTGRAAAPEAAVAVGGRTGKSAAPARTARMQPPPEPSPRTDDANIERILRSIHVRAKGDRATATLRLDPPELGSVRLHMDLRASQMSLVVETRTAEAHRLLESHLDRLRERLDAVGIRLERAEVRQITPPDASADTSGAAQSNTNDAGRQDGSAPSHDGSAGGGASIGTDSILDTDAPEALPVDLGPVAESRVNVWA